MRVINIEAYYSIPQDEQTPFCDRVFVSCSESEFRGSWGISILAVHNGITMTYAKDEPNAVDAAHASYFNRSNKEWMVRLLRGMDNLSERFANYTGEDKLALMAYWFGLFSESDFDDYKWDTQLPYQWRKDAEE